jgi:hypothetical protein
MSAGSVYGCEPFHVKRTDLGKLDQRDVPFQVKHPPGH